VAASLAARAAGQAVAAAHVPQHAFGAAYYALKAIAAADPLRAEKSVFTEHKRQLRLIPKELRQEFLKRVTVENQAGEIFIKVRKDEDS
jgi:hypothetical protein